MSSTTNPTMKTTILMGVKEAEVTSICTANITEDNVRTTRARGAGFRFMARNMDKKVAIGFATNNAGEKVALIWDVDNPDEWLVTSRIGNFEIDFDVEREKDEPNFAYVQVTTANSEYFFSYPE